MAADTLTTTTSSSAIGISTGNTAQASVGMIQSVHLVFISMSSIGSPFIYLFVAPVPLIPHFSNAHY